MAEGEVGVDAGLGITAGAAVSADAAGGGTAGKTVAVAAVAAAVVGAELAALAAPVGDQTEMQDKASGAVDAASSVGYDVGLLVTPGNHDLAAAAAAVETVG